MQLGFFYLLNRIRSLIQQESGQDLVEYALVAALVGLASVTGIHGIASVISTSITAVVNKFTNVVSSAI